MATIKVVGIDGALNNFGVAIGRWDGQKLLVQQIHHIPYHKALGKNKKSISDANHAAAIYRALRQHTKGAKFVFAELVGGSKSSDAAWSLGIALGVISSLPYDIRWVTPYEAKRITGSSAANKKEIISWATKLYPKLAWQTYRGVITSKGNEHMADAIAVLLAGCTTLG